MNRYLVNKMIKVYPLSKPVSLWIFVHFVSYNLWHEMKSVQDGILIINICFFSQVDIYRDIYEWIHHNKHILISNCLWSKI